MIKKVDNSYINIETFTEEELVYSLLINGVIFFDITADKCNNYMKFLLANKFIETTNYYATNRDGDIDNIYKIVKTFALVRHGEYSTISETYRIGEIKALKDTKKQSLLLYRPIECMLKK